MIQPRLIPVLLVKNGSLIKTINFDKFNYIGDPCNTARIFNELEVDEMILLDVDATNQKKINLNLISELASECFMPLTYGGGICRIEDAESLFRLGVEKIVVNTHSYIDKNFMKSLSNEFGSQAIVASIDYKCINSQKIIFSNSGRNKQNYEILNWVKHLEYDGVGEIILTSIDHEGTWNGFDYEFIEQIVRAINIPVIAHGGAGNLEHIKKILKCGVSAVGLGSMVVYQKKNMGVLVNFIDTRKIVEVLNK